MPENPSFGNSTKSKTTQWSNLVDGDVGDYVRTGNFPDNTVQFIGVTGGTVTMKGSNDPKVETDISNSVWFDLTDPQGNVISSTSAGGKLVAEAPAYIRPEAGSGVTAGTVILHSKE